MSKIKSGSFSLQTKDPVVHKQLDNLNADSATLTLGSSTTFRYVVKKDGKYPVLTDFMLRYKCKNSSSNDTYTWISLWNVVDTLKLFINERECYQFKNNLTREARVLRLMEGTEKDSQHKMWNRSRGAGTSFHSGNTIAVSTTSDYHYDSMNDITNIFENLRLCTGIHSIGFELTLINSNALYDSIVYDNSTGSEALSTYFSLVNFDIYLEMSYYSVPQTNQIEYQIPCVKYDRKDFATTFTASASGSYTIDLETQFHEIAQVQKAIIYGRDATASGADKQYLGLGVIDHMTLRVGGAEVFEFFNQYHMLDHIMRSNLANRGEAHWLLPNSTLVTNEQVPMISLDFTHRVRHHGEGVYHVDGLPSTKGEKVEIIAYNGSLTDANMTRLRCILQSLHVIKINKTTGAVSHSKF
jgi:hypothetical protein